MTAFTLTLLDTTGIQDYIFSSNRLQENIGASELVYRATSLWAFEALETAGIKKHNILNPTSLDWQFSEEAIESKPALEAEVIQAAGGNTVILFRHKDQSRKFVQTLTLRLLREAPGLIVMAQHLDDFDFEKDSLPEKREELQEKMQKHKQSRLVSSPTLGLGVTAICDSTGLSAVGTLGGKIKVNGVLEPLGLPGEDFDKLVSSEAAAKRGWRKQANNRLKFMLKDAADDYIFPFELEKLGRFKGEESYIAVIHADGNRMGAHVRGIAEIFPQNRDYINALRHFSNKINSVSSAALKIAVGLVVRAVTNEDIPHVEDEDGKYLPFRPLVFGGDDVTFVCNGLIGVSLAAAYLEAFEREASRQGLPDFHASAGACIVKMHYPFSRAYKLAEELTASAKTLNREPKDDCSALDWHFAQSGLSGSLRVIRKKEYYSDDDKPLYIRPLTLKKGADANTLSWDEVSSAVQAFNKKPWSECHNKVVGLREPLRKSSDAVRQYRSSFDLDKLPVFTVASETGWFADRCAYFDIIELLDHHVSLEPKQEEAKS